MFENRPAGMLIFLGFAALGLSGCVGTNKTSISVDYYQIGGNSLNQIDREIRKKGPKNGPEHAVAVSNIKMTPDIRLTSNARGCYVSKAKIKVIARVTLPRWKNRKKAKSGLGATWDNLDRYTRMHEAVHVAIADKYARLLEQRLLALKPGPTCAETKKLIVSTVDKTMKAHGHDQLKFDASEKARFARLAIKRKKS